jgi:hypothetical protein
MVHGKAKREARVDSRWETTCSVSSGEFITRRCESGCLLQRVQRVPVPSMARHSITDDLVVHGELGLKRSGIEQEPFYPSRVCEWLDLRMAGCEPVLQHVERRALCTSCQSPPLCMLTVLSCRANNSLWH